MKLKICFEQIRVLKILVGGGVLFELLKVMIFERLER